MHDEQQFKQFIEQIHLRHEIGEWLEQFSSAINGDEQSMVNIALLYKEQRLFPEMYDWLNKAVSLQCAKAMYELANCYFEALDGKGNEKEAFELYKKAAQLKHPDAMNNLADMYFNGE